LRNEDLAQNVKRIYMTQTGWREKFRSSAKMLEEKDEAGERAANFLDAKSYWAPLFGMPVE
jgi:hypothetical protein